ncbi:hypothetical protein AC578_1871 [Pseudocercospora eumusae]|uniref:Uncharacterized protein n=1 Tax=Pseudocercospora eumusae TaxID=321146 RepID=A0A139GYF4_9PEZI|nr:hypothetical protein AC578_1871 [Pseudocercospora eumusae]
MARPSSAGSRISMIKWNANHVRADRRRSDSSRSGRSSSQATVREEDNAAADMIDDVKASNETSDTADKLDTASIITFSDPAKVVLSVRRFKRVRWCSRVENIAPLRFSLPPSEVDVSQTQTQPGMTHEVKFPRWCNFWRSLCCCNRHPPERDREEIHELAASPVPRKRSPSPPLTSPGQNACDDEPT